MSTTSKTKELERRAIKVMPGPQSNLRVPAGIKPIFVKNGKGSHIWDVEGKKYIDYMGSAGPAILGHSNKEYIEAIKQQLDTLYHTHPGECSTPSQVELAEKFINCIPCAEKVRYSTAGTEAVQLAIRLARAFTGRNYFIRFEGHYHGWLDNVIGGIVDDNPNNRPHPKNTDNDPLRTLGRDPSAFEHSFLLPWNDIEVLEKVLSKYGEEVALILMEPILCNGGCCPPRPGYLEKIRELCDHYGIIFCFDEIITGFRVGLGGAQSELGIVPDLAIYGKALAAGIPFSAVAGKKEIMDLLSEKKVVAGGTFNGYPLGIAAALATLRIIERDSDAFYQNIERVTNRLMTGLREICKRRNIAALLQGPRGVFKFMFSDRNVAYNVREVAEEDAPKYHRFSRLMNEKGIMLLWNGRWYVNDSLTDDDVDRTLECADLVLGRL